MLTALFLAFFWGGLLVVSAIGLWRLRRLWRSAEPVAGPEPLRGEPAEPTVPPRNTAAA